MMETDESDKEQQQRQNRLEKKREQSRTKRLNETEEQRQSRLEQEKDRSRTNRMNETTEQHQIRLEKEEDRSRASRENETEEQRQSRLQAEKDRSRANRMSETTEQHQSRLEQQRKRTKINKANVKDKRRVTDVVGVRQQNIESETADSEESESCDNADLDHSDQNELLFSRKKSSYSSWPEPISRSLKESCLKKFIRRLSMSELSEVICAICNVRTSAQNSKKVPLSNIPNAHLLKVSDDFKNFIQSTQLSNTEHSNREILTISKNNRIPMDERSQSNRFLYVICDDFIHIF